MRKFYLFRAGQKVPSWMMKVKMNDPKKQIPKSFKMVFGTSCMVMHSPGCQAAVMQAKNKTTERGIIHISGIDNAVCGGIDGACGMFFVTDNCLSEMSSLYARHEREGLST